MAIINYTIEQDGFEIMLDAIGVILLSELANQAILNPAGMNEDFAVFKESAKPMTNADTVAINVWYDNSSFGIKSQSGAAANVTYNIDIYSRGFDAEDISGGEEAANLIHKYLRLCRHILSHTAYNTLGDEYIGMISGTEVKSIEMLEPREENDSSNMRFGRLSFEVRLYEGQGLWNGITAFTSDTGVKLDNTEQGYKYTLINT